MSSSEPANRLQAEDTVEVEHATYTGDDVRNEQDPAALENAQPTHAGQENALDIISEAGVIGGSDNTSGPAGANTYYEGSKEAHDRVVDSELAKQNYENENTADPGISSI